MQVKGSGGCGVNISDEELQRSPVSYINISFFVHATEDREKVLKAVSNCFPSIDFSKISFVCDSLYGHYRNPIIFFETRIKDKELIKNMINDLSSKMSQESKSSLSSELDKYVGEDGSLYLRFDKQSSYNGVLRLCSSDPIRIKIRLSVSSKSPQELESVYKEMGLL